MHTILYARCSTTDQNIEIQQAQAEAAGYRFDDVIHDDGVSGVSTRLVDRKGGMALLKMLRRGDTLVVRWVDRLGRSYADVTEVIRTLMVKGVIVRTVINGMVFDGSTKDPMQCAVRDALIGFMAAMAEAQAVATKEAQAAGIAAARADAKKYRGRKPQFDAEQLQRATEMLAQNVAPATIAREVGISRGAVYRMKESPARMAQTLQAWG